MLLMYCVCRAFASVLAALWSLAGKGLSFVMFHCVRHIPMWYPVSGVVLGCAGS